VPLVELGTGFLLAVLYWRFGLTLQFPVIAFYSCVLLVLAVIDLEQKLLLNIIIYPTAAIAFIISILLPGIGIKNGAIGGAIGFAMLLIPALVSRRGMGWGDVKMAGVIGFMTGFPNVFVAILGGIIIGGLAAIVLILIRKKGRKDISLSERIY